MTVCGVSDKAVMFKLEPCEKETNVQETRRWLTTYTTIEDSFWGTNDGEILNNEENPEPIM